MTWMHMAWIVLSHISLLNSVLRHMTWYHEVYVLTLLIVGVLSHTWMMHIISWHEWYDLMTWIVQISHGKKHMTSNIVLGVLMISCTEDRDFRMKTEGGSLIPHYVCLKFIYLHWYNWNCYICNVDTHKWINAYSW